MKKRKKIFSATIFFAVMIFAISSLALSASAASVPGDSPENPTTNLIELTAAIDAASGNVFLFNDRFINISETTPLASGESARIGVTKTANGGEFVQSGAVLADAKIFFADNGTFVEFFEDNKLRITSVCPHYNRTKEDCSVCDDCPADQLEINCEDTCAVCNPQTHFDVSTSTELADVLDAVPSGAAVTIRLMESFSHNSLILVYDKDITLDLNGFNLDVTLDETIDTMALMVVEGSFITTGEGKLNLTTGNNVTIYAENANVTITGSVTVKAGNVGIFASGDSTVIFNGDVTASGFQGIGIVADDNAFVTVNGNINTSGEQGRGVFIAGSSTVT
ncbi:MAG: hypothetical protein FWD19_00210, partial [Defluviitaleaceae bacterium]|nr:hypothetical protein [Defluviitaleaceae bacterium]